MKEFDKFILQGFYRYCVKNDIDPTDHISLRLAGSTYCHELQNIIINFIEWSIEDDCNNNFSEYVNAEDTGEGADNGTGL